MLILILILWLLVILLLFILVTIILINLVVINIIIIWLLIYVLVLIILLIVVVIIFISFWSAYWYALMTIDVTVCCSVWFSKLILLKLIEWKSKISLMEILLLFLNFFVDRRCYLAFLIACNTLFLFVWTAALAVGCAFGVEILRPLRLSFILCQLTVPRFLLGLRFL